MSDNVGENKFLWIEVLRFPLIIGVVFIHNMELARTYDGKNASLIGVDPSSDFFINLLSNGFARLAVPFFFLFSGFFFFRGLKSASFEAYKLQMYKRLTSLAVPYVFWNVSTLLIYFIAQHYGFSGSSGASKVGVLGDKSILEILSLTFGIGGHPISYQFWFVRDLFLCCILSVAILKLPLRIFHALMLCLFVFWFFDDAGVFIPSSAAMLFFFLGGYFQRCCSRMPFDKIPKAVILVYLALIVMKSYLLLDGKTEITVLLGRVCLIFGLCFMYWVAQYVCSFPGLSSRLISFSKYSFFLFAIHEPTLTIIKKITYRFIVLNPTPIVTIVVYLGNVIIVVLFGCMLWHVFHRISPRFTSLITGGR